MNGSGEIYPVSYLRRNGGVEEDTCPPQALNEFEGEGYRKYIGEHVRRTLG